MLKKTLAFGLLAASTIGFAVPAHAQNVAAGSQTIDSQTVGVNGSNVVSTDQQNLTNLLIDRRPRQLRRLWRLRRLRSYGSTDGPNLVTGTQTIGATTVGANGSNVVSANQQNQDNGLVDSDCFLLVSLLLPALLRVLTKCQVGFSYWPRFMPYRGVHLTDSPFFSKFDSTNYSLNHSLNRSLNHSTAQPFIQERHHAKQNTCFWFTRG